ncbi:delta-1-pyrroline-5-carboxylate synthase-like protein, partial [Tanacetum coccineum]
VHLFDSWCFNSFLSLLTHGDGVVQKIQALYSQGIEVILVSSGAIGAGRQRLSTQTTVNSSSANLEKPQVKIDRKACAAVGQIGLMALYDTLFSKGTTSKAVVQPD